MVHNEGRQPKTTRRWVLLADRMADRTITVGGILVIAAVLGMMLFLVYEALPLFKGGSVLSTTRYDLADKPDRVAGLTQDEYETVAVLASQDGRIRAWHLRSGHQIDVVAPDFQGKEVLSCAVSIDGLHMAFGFSDGTVRLGKIRFAADLLPERQLPEGLKRLDERDSTDGRAIYSLIPGGQVRKTTLDVELGESITVSDSGSPVVMMALRHADFGERPKSVLAALDGQGRPSLIVAESRLNLFTRKVTTKVSKANLPPLPGSADAVAYALVNDSGDEVFFAEKSGTVYRYDTRDLDKPVLTETSRLVPDGVALTALEFLLGDRSIVVGGSDGSVNIFFLLEREGCGSTDGRALVKTRTFQPHCASVSGLSPGQRGKTFATWDRQGEIWIRHGTSQKTILKLKRDESSSVIHALSLAPRLNGLLAVDGKGGGYWSLNIAHPETSLHTLFGKVWYEGYPAPSYTWQSTG
ncbi:MAG: ABC transporter permease, partial [Deltaproteobacteria bacterium]|nr:ABC transporter permease [Deltaproteobacteria bacterium]